MTVYLVLLLQFTWLESSLALSGCFLWLEICELSWYFCTTAHLQSSGFNGRERSLFFSRFIFILYLMSFFIHLRFGSPVLTSIRLTHFPQSCRIKRLSIQMKFNPFTELKCNEFIFSSAYFLFVFLKESCFFSFSLWITNDWRNFDFQP